MIALEPDVIRAGSTLLTAALSFGKERTDQTLRRDACGRDGNRSVAGRTAIWRTWLPYVVMAGGVRDVGVGVESEKRAMANLQSRKFLQDLMLQDHCRYIGRGYLLLTLKGHLAFDRPTWMPTALGGVFGERDISHPHRLQQLLKQRFPWRANALPYWRKSGR